MPGLRWGFVGETTVGREWMIGAIRESGSGEIASALSGDAGFRSPGVAPSAFEAATKGCGTAVKTGY